jgi:hypothetical protein
MKLVPTSLGGHPYMQCYKNSVFLNAVMCGKNPAAAAVIVAKSTISNASAVDSSSNSMK